MLQFSNLTGRRDTKEYKEPFLIASPTQGEFKITPKVAEVLGVEDGQRVVTATLNGQVYITKGKEGEPLLDDDGNEMHDKRGRQLFEEDSTFGVIVRETTPGGSLLKFTSSKAWADAGGNEDENIMFTLGEGVEGELPESETRIKGYTHQGTFYPLVEDSRKAKIARGSSDDDEEDGDEQEDVDMDSDDMAEEV